MRSERGFLYFHADACGGSTLMIAESRARADATYVVAFGANETGAQFASDLAHRTWATVLCDGDFVAEAVIHYPDDVELPEDDIDNEDGGLAIVAGLHTADEWRLDHGMRVYPCGVCPSCGGWVLHRDGCRDTSLVIREGRVTSAQSCSSATPPRPGTDDPLEIEWVTPAVFAWYVQH